MIFLLWLTFARIANVSHIRNGSTMLPQANGVMRAAANVLSRQ
jgi:hypothetical protein